MLKKFGALALAIALATSWGCQPPAATDSDTGGGSATADPAAEMGEAASDAAGAVKDAATDAANAVGEAADAAKDAAAGAVDAAKDAAAGAVDAASGAVDAAKEAAGEAVDAAKEAAGDAAEAAKGAVEAAGEAVEGAVSPEGKGDSSASADGIDETKLVSFSDEDKKAIRAQKICPVGGDSLTGMGEPTFVEHQGKKVFFCCEGCHDAFAKDPAGYLAKLGQGTKEGDS